MTRVMRFLFLACGLLAVPAAVFAQEAVLTGTVTDSTGGVLPGVTVVAVNDATGNRYEAVTDEGGIYRIPVRVGAFTITAELSGFATANRTGVQLLVGQTANVNLQLAPSTVQETVTVTGEAPLLNVSTSSLGGNIDPQQVEELPVQGRNWMGLALLAPGSRTVSGNAQAPLPDRNNGEVREFQLNMDGQQISSELGTGNQPKFSQDSIAEFQFISNRFDATQGRSSGVQVNVITKSGTNSLSGLFRTNFQSDDVQRRRPCGGPQAADQQPAGTARRSADRFCSTSCTTMAISSTSARRWPACGRRRTPRSTSSSTGSSRARLPARAIDYQESRATRASWAASRDRRATPPSAAGRQPRTRRPRSTPTTGTVSILGSLTQVLSNRAVNEIKGGYSHYGFENKTLVNWSKHWQASNGITNGYPRMTFTGFSFNANANAPRHRDQKVTQIRDDFTFSYEARGRHDLRAGFEFVDHYEDSLNCNQCGGNDRRTRDTSWPAAHSDAGADGGVVPGSMERGHLELCSDLSLDTDLHDRHRGVPEPVPSAEVRCLGAGRLADHRQSHTEPRPALRLEPELVCERPRARVQGRSATLLCAGPTERHQQHPAAPRVCLFAERPHGDPRGIWALLFRRADGRCVLAQVQHPAAARLQYTNDGRANFGADPLNGAPLPTYDQAQTQLCNSAAQAANFAAWRASQLRRHGALHPQRAPGDAGAG